ncbi:MAG: rhodanese-like domain-containing protein [Chlamydiota bacterium]|nr:rhodanese-like domain-containing protein [Chlamydiota bacterium]
MYSRKLKIILIILIGVIIISLECQRSLIAGETMVPHHIHIQKSEKLDSLTRECLDRYPDVPSISLKEFLKQQDLSEWVILDVRSKSERDISIIPGAIDAETFDLKKDTFRNKKILVYCTIGCRSGAYGRVLQKKGYHAVNLRGGVLAWAFEGKLFVTREGHRTKKVHVYGEKWNVLPEGYEPIID